MKKDLYYRVDQRLQNGVIKYYLLREINSDTQKFRATKLIKCGTLPTDAEVARIILLHGFDLEMKCCEKVAAYRVNNFKYHFPMDEEAYTNLEKYRYLDMRYHEYLTKEEYAKHGKEREYNYIHESTKTVGNTFTLPEIYLMLDTDKIPNNKTLRDVNEIQNLHNCTILRMKNPRKITLPLILKLRSMILSNIEEESETLTRENEAAIRRLITAYYKNIDQGYHPFEQILLWYQAFRHLKPFKIGTNRVAREVVHYMMMAIGYPRTFQTSYQVMKESNVFAGIDLGKNISVLIEKYIEERIPVLEADIRQKITERWDMHKNKLQKQLDLYLRPEM